MVEAVKTTATTGEIWAIVVVAVVCLAIWLGSVAWMAEHPLWPHHRQAGMPGRAPLADLPAQRGAEIGEPGRSTAPAGSVPDMPAQRTGTADRPAHSPSGAGPHAADERGTGG